MEIANLVLEYIRALVWPAVAITASLLFRKQIDALLARLRHADLPGGVSIDLQEQIAEAKELSSKVQSTPSPPERKRGPSIPLTEANARMIHLGLRPSTSGLDMSYHRQLAEQDPNVALAGLRIEVEVLAHNLAKGFNIALNRHESGTRLLRRLYDYGAIDSQQMQLAMKIMSVCNAAVHGSPVTQEEASAVIDTAEVLTDQYIAWLSWGFDDGGEPVGGQQ
jgi:hypothetical protein